MTSLTLDVLLAKILEGLGYSERLIQKALMDLQKIIAFRFYTSVNDRLSNPQELDLDNPNIDDFVKRARRELSQEEIDNLLLKTTDEVISDYFNTISK